MADKLRIRARLPDDLLETITQVAKTRRVSVSVAIEDLLRGALKGRSKWVYLVYPTKDAPVAAFTKAADAIKWFKQELAARGIPEDLTSDDLARAGDDVEKLNTILDDLHIVKCSTD